MLSNISAISLRVSNYNPSVALWDRHSPIQFSEVGVATSLAAPTSPALLAYSLDFHQFTGVKNSTRDYYRYFY